MPISTRFENLPSGAINASGREITQNHQEVAAAATMAVTLLDAQINYVTITGDLGAAGTINLTLPTTMQDSDLLYLTIKADATGRTVSMGTKLTGADIVLGTADDGGLIAMYDSAEDAFIVIGSATSG